MGYIADYLNTLADAEAIEVEAALTKALLLPTRREVLLGDRAYISQSVVSSPRWARGRMFFQLADDSPFARFEWPNWWVSTGTVGEVAGTGPLRMTAAVENVIGGGITPKVAGNAAGGDNVNILIPGNYKKYTWYGVRYWAKFDAQMIYRGKWNTTGDNFEFSATELSDNTEGGAYGGAGGSPDFCFPPVSISGLSRKAAVAVIADSRGAGQEDMTRSDRRNLLGPFERAFGELDVPWANFARPALRAEGFMNSGARSTALINKYASIVHNALGVNDLSSKTAAEIMTILETINARFNNGQRVYQATIEPNTTSTDAFVSVAGQTPTSSNTKRNDLNTLIRSSLKTAGVIDIARYAGHPTSPDVFAPVPYGAPTGIAALSDGLHMQSPAIIDMVMRGVIQPWMVTR